jgi:expansin (peptidoglycan-binding protein)
MIPRLARMAHRPSGPGRIPRRRLTGRAGLAGRRLAGFRAGTVAAAGAGVVVVLVALAVGISQATAAPACASVIMPGTATARGAATATGAMTGSATVTGTAAGAQTSGEATHYELASGGMGNCSYPSPPAGQLYVALSPSEYGGSAACGSYLQVTGPDGSVTVEVVDQCPECQAGHIDLSEQAFAEIAPLSAGLVPVTYHTIVDPPLPASLSMLVKAGSSAYYLALLPVNNGDPLATMAVSQGSGGWQELSRTTYGYWLASSGAGPGPFSVRLTDSLGHQATVHGITISPGVVQSTGVSMYGAGAVAVTPTAAATTATPAAAHKARKAHRHRRAQPTASPDPSWGISITAASTRPAAASPTPSCPSG